MEIVPKKTLIPLVVLACLVVGLSMFFIFHYSGPKACPYECCGEGEHQEKACPANHFCKIPLCYELKLASTRGSEFVLGDEVFHFIGAFTFSPLTHYVYEPWRGNWKEEIDNYLDSLKLLGLRVMRFFAFGPYEIEISGREEPNWERLDYLMEQCEKRGIYVIFVLWDYWDYSTESEGGPQAVYRFWEDARIKQFTTAMVTRYKASHAIFAWELINEGDLVIISDYFPQLYAFTKEMATYIKSLDPRHLVGTGFSHETLRESYFETPSFYQAARQRVIEINELGSVDFMTFHSYGGPIDRMVDAGWYGEAWENQMKWLVNEAVTLRQELEKPILFEEWGAQRQVGEETREKVYSFLLQLFREDKIDNIFNGWGNEKEPQSMLIYAGSPEANIVWEAIKEQ